MTAMLFDIQPYPGTAFDLQFAARRVTGTITLPAPNPKGRTVCRVVYRIPNHWNDAENTAALRVAAHWFKAIGGFGQIAHRQLCHIVQRFKEKLPGENVNVAKRERCMHWAIDAYASSDWHRTHQRFTTLGRFFMGDHYEGWLEKSAGYQDWVRQRRRRENQAAEAAVDAEATRQRERMGLPRDVTKLSDEQLSDELASAEQAAQREAEAQRAYGKHRETVGRTAWEKLSGAERKQVFVWADGQFPDAAPDQRGLGNDAYRRVAYDRAYLVAKKNDVPGVPDMRSPADFRTDAPKPRYKLADLRADLRAELPRRKQNRAREEAAEPNHDREGVQGAHE